MICLVSSDFLKGKLFSNPIASSIDDHFCSVGTTPVFILPLLYIQIFTVQMNLNIPSQMFQSTYYTTQDVDAGLLDRTLNFG